MKLNASASETHNSKLTVIWHSLMRQRVFDEQLWAAAPQHSKWGRNRCSCCW